MWPGNIAARLREDLRSCFTSRPRARIITRHVIKQKPCRTTTLAAETVITTGEITTGEITTGEITTGEITTGETTTRADAAMIFTIGETIAEITTTGATITIPRTVAGRSAETSRSAAARAVRLVVSSTFRLAAVIRTSHPAALLLLRRTAMARVSTSSKVDAFAVTASSRTTMPRKLRCAASSRQAVALAVMHADSSTWATALHRLRHPPRAMYRPPATKTQILQVDTAITMLIVVSMKQARMIAAATAMMPTAMMPMAQRYPQATAMKAPRCPQRESYFKPKRKILL